MTEEIWKNISCFGDDVSNIYEVSSHGRLRRIENDFILKPYIVKDGSYHRYKINLKINGKTYTMVLGKIVLSTFVRPKNCNEYVSYINGDFLDDRLENLEWCDMKASIAKPRSSVSYDIHPNGSIKCLDFAKDEVQVSSDGYIKSKLSGWTCGNLSGNYYVKSIPYNMDGTKTGPNGYSYRVHVLVAHAFIGPRPDKLVIDHINGDKLDNRASNLRYVTNSENMKRAYGDGKLEGPGKKVIFQYEKDTCNFIRKFDSVSDACKYLRENIESGKNANTGAVCEGIPRYFQLKSTRKLRLGNVRIGKVPPNLLENVYLCMTRIQKKSLENILVARKHLKLLGVVLETYQIVFPRS